jgi:hypothetical protein
MRSCIDDRDLVTAGARGFRCINYTVVYWTTVVITHTGDQGSVP